MKRNKLLDIDVLRGYGVTPEYFGLGMIQLKISDTSRLHFYHDDLPVLVDEPHNHRYPFHSSVLNGSLYQEIFEFVPETYDKLLYDNQCSHVMAEVSCDPAKPGTRIIAKGGCRSMMATNHLKGSSYWISADTFHTVLAADNCITLLDRNAKAEKEFASVIRAQDSVPVCPFSAPINEEECWRLIEDMLPKKKKKKKFGYHLADIPKGEIGEANKLVEEALEVLDAHEQGVKIMAMHELSDLYGAMERYREKYHPELSMDDIRDMYLVTRRAFDSGRRT